MRAHIISTSDAESRLIARCTDKVITRNPLRRIDEATAFHRFDGSGMMWILMQARRRSLSPSYNADTDLIMEWLVDFVLTHCNFWERRAVPRKGKRNKERAGRERLLLPDTTYPGTRMSTWVACVKGRRKGGRRAPHHEEYPSRARNLFVGRPQTVQRYGIVWLAKRRRRRENVKPIQRAHKDGRKRRKESLKKKREKISFSFSPLNEGRRKLP